jgi:8-oxo-dGTP pyrophosphatase MutT (NUDIX family)
MEPWDVLGSYQHADYVIFRARIDTLRSPRGAQGDFIILECPEWVNVVALTEDRQAIMVRQFRHGVRAAGLEFPGGMVDPGESPFAAARRELLEETGYEAGEWKELGFVHPNPATQTNRCWTYLATGCRKVAELRLDTTEELSVELYPEGELAELVRRGEITHSLVVAAMYWLGQESLERAPN